MAKRRYTEPTKPVEEEVVVPETTEVTPVEATDEEVVVKDSDATEAKKLEDDAAKAKLLEEEEAAKIAEEENAKKEAEEKAKQAEIDAKSKKASVSKNPLTDSKVSIDEKVKYCLTEATGKIRSIANILESYNETMKPGAVQNEKLMVRKQYELVNLYRDIFSNEDYGTFKAQFDIVNLFFNKYAKESMGGHYLSRFDYLWQWDQEELTTLLNVNEVISQLADYANRTKRLKQLNLEYALNPDETIVTNAARDNIIRYYGA